MIGRWHPDVHRRALAAGMLLVTCAALWSCDLVDTLPEQLAAVERFNKNSERVHLACLDINADGQVNATDADPQRMPDITGDGTTDDADLNVVSEIDFTLPGGPPTDCGRPGEPTDWQIGPAADIDCAAGRGGYLVYGVGGGAVDLTNRTNAAGARWMVIEIGDVLSARGVPYQLISMAPGLTGTTEPQPDSEDWAFAYFSEQLRRQPCLELILIGHSHGGTSVAATAYRLEQAGLGGQIALSALVDRVTELYAGDTQSIPQTSPVFNIFLANGENYVGRAFDQANVENWDATGQEAPEHGEKGGPLKTVTHTTIDNSRAVLDEIIARIENLPLYQQASG